MKLNLFTVVWGAKHLGWFERACARSLAWPKNKAAIQNATWHVFTKKEDIPRALSICQKTGVNNIEVHEIPDHIEGNSPQMGALLLQCLLSMMNNCLNSGSHLLTCPPDSIFSDGSVATLLALGKYGPTCVAVPHPRVNATIFGSLKDDEPLSGATLVNLTMKHGHRAWTEAELGHKQQNSFVGGITWQRIGENLIAVQHRLPTVYLASFLPSDFTFFQQPHDGLPPTYGAWDHTWPSDLIKDGRLRVVGSSDAAFIAEVTEEGLNIPPSGGGNPHEPDSFWRAEYHNKILRQFVSIFKGE